MCIIVPRIPIPIAGDQKAQRQGRLAAPAVNLVPIAMKVASTLGQTNNNGAPHLLRGVRKNPASSKIFGA